MSKPQTIDELMHHLKYENGIDIDGDEQRDQLICYGYYIMVPFVKTNFGTIIMCHYLPYMYHVFFYAAVSKLSPKTSAGVLYPNASCGL